MPGTDSFLNAGEVALFGSWCQAGPDGVQVDIDHAGGDGGIVEKHLAFEPGFPETAFDAVFLVGGACDVFIEVAHEPAQAAESFTQHGDTFGTEGEIVDLLFYGIIFRFFRPVPLGAESKPAGGDFIVGPSVGDIGTNAKSYVIVVGHDGEGRDIDGEDGGKEAETV